MMLVLQHFRKKQKFFFHKVISFQSNHYLIFQVTSSCKVYFPQFSIYILAGIFKYLFHTTMKVLGLLKRVQATAALPVAPASFSLYRHLSDAAPSAPKDPANKFTYPPVYDPYGPSPPPSSKILDLADRIASLPPGEIKQIGPALFVRLNQPLPRTLSGHGLGLGSSQAAGGAKSEEKKKEEKTVFDVKLEKFDTAAKIKVIKEVRGFTNLGLKEAKELVEKAPIVVKQGVTKEEAKEIMEKIKAAGGVAVME
jgi:large subunit ribosomal protein L7/L12